jgi:hypothetical protein
MKPLIAWPTKEQILANLPSSFIEMPDVRIVIDATEFFCEKPSSLTHSFSFLLPNMTIYQLHGS